MRRLIPIALVLLALAGVLAACGESDADQARDEICEARDGIATSVADLQAETLTSVTADQVQSDVESIQGDLQTISENVGELDEDRRSEVQSATDEFRDQVADIASGLQGDLSLEGAEARFRAALTQLETAYRSSLETIDCS